MNTFVARAGRFSVLSVSSSENYLKISYRPARLWRQPTGTRASLGRLSIYLLKNQFEFSAVFLLADATVSGDRKKNRSLSAFFTERGLCLLF